ncbi:cell division protein FtsQ/DivIB [Tellurirhabdus rosea]|uniref:cell division protein FtsQ/DivIB n=1 Tax=Tellurirhabdus rosea TaxID=2674997 RepID=UPI002253AFCD|nr:hypothetical protein [Tellurirhabdus rosea]
MFASLLTGAGLLGLIAFTEVRQEARRVEDIRIRMDEIDGHRFLNRNDVLRSLTRQDADPIAGTSLTEIDLKVLEKRLRQNGYISRAQVYRDLQGNLVAEIEQQRPLARLVGESEEELSSGSGRYLSEEGTWFPLSLNYTARVPVLSGAYFENRKPLTGEKDKDLVELLKWIRADPFWKAQIAQVRVDSNREVTLLPQVGEHLIEIGQPTDLSAKFDKLKLFYKHILSRPEGSRYRRVSVQYRNQIVCE